MTHRDQLGSFLGGADAGEPRHLQRISFRIFWQFIEDAPFDSHECVRGGGSLSFRLGRHIHHAGAAFLVVMGQFRHFGRTRISSPTAHSARPGSVTRKALQRASETTSPEPCDTWGSMQAPSGLRRAGKKRVSPAFWRTGRVRRASARGSAPVRAYPAFFRSRRARWSQR